MQSLDDQKKVLRKKVKELKALVPDEEMQQLSRLIFEKLEQLPAFLNAEVVLAYWSMTDEARTHEFVQRWAGKKIVLLPVVIGSELEMRRFTSLSDMKAGDAFGIMEPQGEPWRDIQLIDFIVVPGVAFDRQNNRMGRGRAYYDKLLVSTRAFKAGVCFDFQLFDSIPADERDVKMDVVITDQPDCTNCAEETLL